jgi:peptidoglycan/xylan/chitin deacetylase (PgdA/CDA1 family)
MATRFIAAYDTESPGRCLAACRSIAAVHERMGVPATFYIVGKRLEEEGAEYRALLGDSPLFEIASHTYSHRMLRDHPFCGPPVDDAARRQEIVLGKERVEQTFARPCLGLRPGCSFDAGLRGDAALVSMVAEAGFRYVSSLLWGPQYTMPALLERPFTYAGDGAPGLWELPGHGWHENLLKAHNLTDRLQRIIAWPLLWPEATPAGPLTTPEEEARLNALVIDRAAERDLPYVSLIWHPWSLHRFDPAMRMLEATFRHARDRGLSFTTFADESARLHTAASALERS